MEVEERQMELAGSLSEAGVVNHLLSYVPRATADLSSCSMGPTVLFNLSWSGIDLELLAVPHCVGFLDKL